MNNSDIIIESHGAGDSRDAIIIGLVGEGMTLNGATKLYAKVAKEQGWTTAIVSHKAAALAYLDDSYGTQWDASDVANAVVELVGRYQVAESTARDYCKAYSEQLGVAHPTADPRAAMFQFLIDNAPHMEYDGLKDAFKEFALDLGRSPSNINEYWKGYDLHVALVQAGV